MELLDNLALGFEVAFSAETLFYCFVGVTLGTLIGVLPGIGALAAISILLPLTFYIPPSASIIMLAGIYYGANYGGSTAAILLNLPGTPSAAVACLDGYPMARQGRAGVALFITTIASFVGSTLTIFLIAGVAPLLAGIARSFGPAEYFSMMLLGLIIAATVAEGPIVKSLVSVVLGVSLGLVGMDVNTGVQRYTFGVPQLYDGLSLVALAMGLFGISEVISNARKGAPGGTRPLVRWREMLPSLQEWRRSAMPMLRGSAIGAVVGALPGAGPSIASFFSYGVEKRLAKEPERFGKGAIEGLTAPESANNAAAQAAFIPTLTLGIPGDAIMALILGALIIHGITPGPALISGHGDLFWGLIVSFWIGNILLLVLNIPLVGVWVRILTIPYSILFPIILLLICVGVYSIRYSAVDVAFVAMFGALGYAMLQFRINPAPMLLGFILGPLMEENFRRAMMISRGDYAIFVDTRISLAFLLIALVLVSSRGVARAIRALRR